MIANKHFVFLHLHKTGGQFVNRLLLQYVPDAQRVGYHLPRHEAPPQLRDLPALVFVRNPWDWYVSWYAFNASNPLRNPIFRAVSNSGLLDFRQTIGNLLLLGDDGHAGMRRRIAAELPETRENNFGSGITRAVMAAYSAPEAGYLTWLMSYMCAIDGSFAGLHVGKMERLRTDLLRLLKECASPPSVELATAVASAPAVNALPRRDYRSYYEPGLRDLIAERDRGIIETYGYRF